MSSYTVRTRSTRGFTLIELMIAVAVVGILAAIAYPSYVQYVKRGNRADAMQLLQQGAQEAERYFTRTNTYDGMTAANIFAGESSVAKSGVFTFTVNRADASSFELRATASATKANKGDGYFMINHTGAKVWKHPDGDKSWSDRAP